MTTIEQDLQSFTQFVHERLKTEARGLNLAELFDLWVIEHPAEADFADNIAAVTASIEDFKRGERGTPAGEHSEELRRALGISKK